MAGKKGMKPVLPEIRGGLRRAIKIMAEQGRPISTVWLELAQDEPEKFLALAIKVDPPTQKSQAEINGSMAVSFDTNNMDPEVLKAVFEAKRAQAESGSSE